MDCFENVNIDIWISGANITFPLIQEGVRVNHDKQAIGVSNNLNFTVKHLLFAASKLGVF